MSSNTLPLAITTGVAALMGSIAAWKIKSLYASLENNKEKELTEIVHDLNIENIAALLKSSDFKIRQSAEQLLLDRTARKWTLSYILKQCIVDDIKQVVKAVTAIHLLVKSSEYAKAKLINCQATEILTKTIENISKNFDYNYLVQECKENYIVEKVLNHCVASLFHLLLHTPSALAEFSKEKTCIKEILVNILGDHSFYISTEVRRWSTYILHQLVQQEVPIKSSLRQWGIIRKATRCIIVTAGDILQIQLCLQILVQYLNDSAEEMVQICKEMATLGILSHLVGLLRSDDDENVVQLSAILIHNFCCFDVDIFYLAQIPGFVKILYSVLSSTDYGTQHTILRICNYLSVESPKFRKSLLDYKPLIKKLSVFMSSNNIEVMRGSLMLIHDLLMPDKSSVQKLVKLNPEIIKSLVKLSFTCKNDTVQLIAETLGYLCSCEPLHSLILEYGVVNSILHFAKSSDVGVQFWASALLLNISMISDQMKETIIQNGGINILLEMAVSGDEVDLPDIATNATKTLVILGFLDSSINVKLTCGLESSIIIDGKEHCPGKQGINLVSLDFINYKYSKGQVIQPSELEVYLTENMDSIKKSDSLFIVTQGDCTVLELVDQPSIVFKKFLKNEDFSFLCSPAWCLILTSQHCEVIHGVENLTMQLSLPMSELISAMLQENFTIPLIDVLLAVPTTTTLCKTEELKQLEILARHFFQRKVIVTSTSFLGYLNELIWNVADWKDNESYNQTLVAHCTAALKILHLCSIDKESVNSLFSCGLVDPLVELIMSLIPRLVNKIQNTKPIEEKPALLGQFDKSVKGSINEQKNNTDLELEEAENRSYISSEEDTLSLLEEVTYSNDDIFLLGNEIDFKKHSVTFCCENQQKGLSRLRSDSYILRNRTFSLDHLQRSSTEPSDVFDETDENEQTVLTSHGRTFSISASHQQMRRISRTLSASLQQTKSADFFFQINEPNEVTKELTKQTLMIVYHLLKNCNKEISKQICSTHILSVLYCIVGCFNGNFQKCFGLTLSSSILHLSKVLGSVSEPLNDSSVSMVNSSSHHTSIISSDGLQITNENWFFETVTANQYVSRLLYSEVAPLGWYYEVTVLTDGIMQIGWATEKSVFSPEKGIGVGDNTESCGFDGARCKIWDGPSIDSLVPNDYGIEWQPGDVVSVLLSWDGIVSFWMNGKDMGPASKKLDANRKWFPAISLSAGQYCTFAFAEEDFRYSKPSGFHSVAELKCQTKNYYKYPKVNLLSTYQPLPGILFEGTSQMVYYFEVELSSYILLKDITIGYLNPADQPLSCYTKTLSYYGGNIFGCGVLLPSMELIVTCNGEIVFREPINFSFSDESFLQLLPFVSTTKVKLNVGDRLFSYKEANKSIYKQGFANSVYNIMIELDRVS